ncbi:hypothetical protein Y88_0110 [Novosphingobium nitrogenifigens DSM 19370]|uniref:Uncharacterized protein n=1 Tax=Novosphingobium nitrogenifigens DSM 19370 TaxID=983920 RepID=F1ZB75_9SPHN|nr:hypothetical protein Y88_0110 [Novosphingobium nitrogenifigens DSM 19370]
MGPAWIARLSRGKAKPFAAQKGCERLPPSPNWAKITAGAARKGA